ncbi:MAG: hypothetical protein AAF560_16160 [Acidobacteriota bacterium]
MSETRGLGRFFTAPAMDVWQGMERCLEVGFRGLLLLFVGLLVGWWIYVPLHELLHAFACIAAGGTVSELEIDTLYGGGPLSKVFPFVTAGSDYAGRLSGFDTGGSDAVYLATDFGPYLLTLFPGVWALRRAAGRRQAFLFGFWMPFALAPFMSLTGDAYEIGSIVTTWIPPWAGMDEILRSDDIFRLFPELGKLANPPWGGAVVGILIGTLWAFATYALAGWLADRLDRRQAV